MTHLLSQGTHFLSPGVKSVSPGLKDASPGLKGVSLWLNSWVPCLNCWVPSSKSWRSFSVPSGRTLTILEVVNLLSIGISSYNVKAHIPNDVPSSNGFINSEYLKSQNYINDITEWTSKQKMKLNSKKSQLMIFNFTNDNQFTTRVKMENEVLPVVNKAKLLGTIITNDLKWSENTSFLVKKANGRLQLLRRAANYTKSTADLKSIYLSHVRNKLEQSCAIWHSNLTEENKSDLERVQKNECRIILGNQYVDYEDSLKRLNLENLSQRRENLTLSFAINCTENEKNK